MSIYWPNNIIVIKNRYYFSYLHLINKAKFRLIVHDNYYEKHHILPKCMGGNDKNENIVYLTAKEHYLAHRFLTRFVTENYIYKILYALDSMGMMSRNTINRYRMPARVYELNKLKISQIGHSEETKKKIGNSNRGRSPINKGVPRSEETKQKISKGHIGKTGHLVSEKAKQISSKYHSNSTWIVNNENKRKRIPKEELQKYLNLGWVNKKYLHKTKNLKMARKHSKEFYEKSGKHLSNLKWISNKYLNKRLRVPEHQLSYYLENDWVLGRK